jgi:hypothetical protein
MAVNLKYDRIFIVLLVLGIVAYAAFQPQLRLKGPMPTEFLDETRLMVKKRTAEEQIANAYWKIAVTQVQWKYGYGYRLPDSPPPEFNVNVPELGPAASDPAYRLRYWRSLQRVWTLPSAWEKSYAWDLNAMTRSLQSAGRWLESQAQGLIGSR